MMKRSRSLAGSERTGIRRGCTLRGQVAVLAGALGVLVGALPAAAESPQPLVIADAWVRAMPPGRPMTAAYLRIANPGAAPVIVSGVTSSVGEASLHESRRVDGQMQMRELPRLEVPAAGETVLAPGGLHIMLMGLESTPAEGDTLRLCLVTDTGEVCTDAPVRRQAPQAS